MIDMKFLGVLVFAFVLLIGLTVIITLLALGLFLGKVLIRYIRSGKVRKEKAILKKSLGEVLRHHRTIPALRLKHRSGGCGTASALPKCSIIHKVLSALLA